MPLLAMIPIIGQVALAIGAAVLIYEGVKSYEDSPQGEIAEMKVEEDAKKVKQSIWSLMHGIVTTVSNILSSQKASENVEIIDDITSVLESTATSTAMNVAQDIIAGLNDGSAFDSVSGTIAEGVNDVTADVEKFQASQREGTWIETVPAYEQQPWVETYPAHENTAPQIESFPAIQKEASQISVFPDTKQDIPSINPFPAERPKELGDSILEAKIIPKTGTWIPVGKTEEEWLEDNGYHLGTNTIKPAPNEHRKSFPLKDSNENIIGRVDRGYRVNGQVVVDHVHLNTDVGNVHHWFNDKPKRNKKEKK
ncbi:hypothetical protein [Clostridium beijerinckii]|uniref:hypothetical protein n=1 Tax=Clostridium beijerinckii TaxID=1520 RepID=UPI00098CE3C3|nr:hypothetical protein [Clostridium beijerinckii]MBA8934632.1 hypothetical protein [Clostridium beijerinckii]NRU39032.1 hypothetical protein [Clostridium beijerinckii]NSA97689.1 hypothetical protein [Clostridium beijerinckii]OOM60836.1 hypothetical protein CLOBI_28960 [Clostridium beijerinckii]OOM69291.1 hypothetical protein CLBEIC_28370 [Clostridium beijerinckii]